MIGELIQVYKELSNRNHGIALVWEIICLFLFVFKHMPSSCPLSANLWSLLFNLQASKLFSEDCKWTRECGYHVSMILRLISDNMEQVNKITNILLVGFSINLSKSQLGEWNCDTTKNDELRVRLASTLWTTNLSILISKICIGSSPEIVQIRAYNTFLFKFKLCEVMMQWKKSCNFVGHFLFFRFIPRLTHLTVAVRASGLVAGVQEYYNRPSFPRVSILILLRIRWHKILLALRLVVCMALQTSHEKIWIVTRAREGGGRGVPARRQPIHRTQR